MPQDRETRALIVLHSSTSNFSNSKWFKLMAWKIKRLLSKAFRILPKITFCILVSRSLHPSSDCQTANKFQKPFIVSKGRMLASTRCSFFAQNKRWTLNVKDKLLKLINMILFSPQDQLVSCAIIFRLKGIFTQ